MHEQQRHRGLEAQAAFQRSHVDSPGRQLLRWQYANFTGDERRVPNPNDEFSVGLKPTEPEWKALTASGLSEEKIRAGMFTRAELRGAGFFFKNTIGGGEKGIIAGSIPDPADPERSIDFTGRKLLTRQEVEAIYAYQQQHPALFGMQGESVDDVRTDMLSFMQNALNTNPFGSNSDFLHSVMPVDALTLEFDREWDESDAKLVEKFWRAKMKEASRAESDRSQRRPPHSYWIDVRERFAREHLADLYTWEDESTLHHFGQKEVRGVTVQSKQVVRGRSLNQPSPFLDSGFIFGRHIEIDVWMNEPTEGISGVHRRLNMVNMHLMGAHPDFPGFSEMGQQDWDQRYMTPAEYIREVYKRDPEERAAVQGVEMDAVHTSSGSVVTVKEEAKRRIIAAAKEWDAQRPKGLRRLIAPFHRKRQEEPVSSREIPEIPREVPLTDRAERPTTETTVFDAADDTMELGDPDVPLANRAADHRDTQSVQRVRKHGK